MITKKCPEKHITTLKCHITKFYQCEPLNLLDHLYTEYRTITSSNLTANFDFMTVCWNPPTPITELFQRPNDGKDSAEEGNEIINDRKLPCLCYEKVHASVLFRKTFKIWREKVYIDKTYAKFPHSGPNKRKIISIINQHQEHKVS